MTWDCQLRPSGQSVCGTETAPIPRLSANLGFAESPTKEEFTSDRGLVPRPLVSAPDNAPLMTFACEKHAITWSRQVQCKSDSIPPVRAAKQRLPDFRASLPSPRGDLGDDGVRIFESGVLARNHAHVREPGRDCALQRPLLDVSLTGTP